MNTFDFIRNSLNRIADGISSSDGSYPVWDYRALMELMNTLEGEYRKKMPGLGADYAYGFSDGYMTGQKNAHSQWIPCSERLPEDGTIALVCGKKGGIRVARVFIPYATGNWDGNPNTNWWTIVGTGKPFFPVAWMPLPEPYREGEQDE